MPTPSLPGAVVTADSAVIGRSHLPAGQGPSPHPFRPRRPTSSTLQGGTTPAAIRHRARWRHPLRLLYGAGWGARSACPERGGTCVRRSVRRVGRQRMSRGRSERQQAAGGSVRPVSLACFPGWRSVDGGRTLPGLIHAGTPAAYRCPNPIIGPVLRKPSGGRFSDALPLKVSLMVPAHAAAGKVGSMQRTPPPVNRLPAPFAQACRLGSRVAVDRRPRWVRRTPLTATRFTGRSGARSPSSAVATFRPVRRSRTALFTRRPISAENATGPGPAKRCPLLHGVTALRVTGPRPAAGGNASGRGTSLGPTDRFDRMRRVEQGTGGVRNGVATPAIRSGKTRT